jgi:ubiquinone/menaquinone biosynthesis C-methylase UbiE
LTLRDRFEVLSWKIQRYIAPGFKPAYVEYEELLDQMVDNGISWLDLGCGHKMLAPWRAEKELEITSRTSCLVGIDPDLESLSMHRSIRLRSQASVSALPFKENSFDLVTANMVVEHLDEPVQQFAEVLRVMKHGGVFLFLTPNAQSPLVIISRSLPDSVKSRMVGIVEGRKETEVYPTLYLANTCKAITAAATAAGFSQIEVRLSLSLPEFIAFPPLAFFELLWLRVLMSRRCESRRPNIIGILRKGQ